MAKGTLSVVSRDGLITLELTAGRAQDLVDIQNLGAATGTVNRAEHAALVEARLRQALAFELEVSRDGVGMSAAAITERLVDLAQMSALCFELGTRDPR